MNEAFFDDLVDADIDKTYSDLYNRTSRNVGRGARPLRSLSQGSRRMLREEDPTETRDGCSSIACPAGYKSRGDNNKDGVFPCELCENHSLNPYIGSNRCFEINQDTIMKIFYNSTNGPEWVGGENWPDSSVPTCEKEGVTCNNKGDVISIVLPYLGLTGTLPGQLGFLSHLQTLNVKSNKIGGKLPVDLRFPPLEHLDISDNVMTDCVPSGLCRKSGVNGSGKDGIFACDTIPCQPGSASPIGRADAGVSGLKCTSCMNALYLGSTACVTTTTSSSNAIAPIVLAVLSLSVLLLLVWVFMRSSMSKNYIKSIYAPPEEN